MREYHKIPALFERDTNGSKKVIIGKFKDETVQFLSGLKWCWTEKIDGTNIRIHWDGHKVEVGGRTDRAQIPADLVNYLNAVFCTNEAEELFEQKFGDADVILFGEGYGRKIQKAGSLYKPDGVAFALFDVLFDGSLYLKRDAVQDIAASFGVIPVPIVGYGSIEEAVSYVKSKSASLLNPNAQMEGVVARPCYELYDRRGNRVIVKIKVCDVAE